MRISVVIPVFNEEENLLRLYERVTAALAGCPEVDAYELIVVDDGSTDAGVRRLATLSDPRLRVVRLPVRRGQSAAFHAGIEAAAYEVLATLDADLQNDPVEIPAMLRRLAEGADFVQGWRTPRRDPLSKRAASRVANAIRRWVLKDPFHDISCSQRVFKKETVRAIDFFPGAHRFLPYLVQQAGFIVVECAVGHHPRVAGRSKYGVSNRIIGPLKDLIRLAIVNRPKPLHAFRRLGYLSILGFLLAGVLTINRYGYGDDEQWMLYRGERAYQIVRSFLPTYRSEKPALTSETRFWKDPLGDEVWNFHDSRSGKEFWNYHPSFYALINYRLFSRLLSRWGVPDIPAAHLLNLITAALALLAVFKLAAEMLGEEEALYAVFFMMFFPRFIAHAQYNPKNIPAMAPLIVSILYTYRSLRNPSRKNAALCGLWMGIAAAVNLQSLELLLVFPLTMLFFRPARPGEPAFTEESSWRHSPMVTYVMTLFLTLFLLWPNLWTNPLLLMNSIRHYSTTSFDQREFLYFGTPYHRPSVPWHYYPFFLFVSTPLLTWIFIGAGLGRLADPVERQQRKAAWFILLAWAALPLVIRMNPWAIKYNQIRHIFYCVPPMMIMAGSGLKAVLNRLRKGALANNPLWPSAPVYAGLLVYFAGQLIPIHPYEGEYFNELLRGIYPRHIKYHFEFPIWQSGYREALAWLNHNAAPQSVIRVPYMFYVIHLYQKRPDLQFENNGPADYTVVAGPDFRTGYRYIRKSPVFEVQRYHSRLVAIFKDTPGEISQLQKEIL